MADLDDRGKYFQTTFSVEDAARKAAKSKNTKGNAIKLDSKILAAVIDPENAGQVYLAEAAGRVRRLAVESCKTIAVYSGPTAPVTSVAVYPARGTVFAGCWDKTIWSWSIKTRKPGIRFQGHGDFVKAVLAFQLQGKHILVSGSADATIIIWDATTGQKLHLLKGHTRGILSLTIDLEESQNRENEVVIFSAGSDREIRRWSIGLASASELKAASETQAPIIAHETSIDSIRFDSDGDLWTASADKCVNCLSRARNWEIDTTLEHPDFVRDVVVDEEGGWVVTACRDEEVRVWEKGTGKPHHVFSGHFEEVTGLVLLPGQKVVSVSIDATVRQWSLKAQDLVKAIKEAEDEKEEKVEEKIEKKEGLMTEDEEAELAALMEDSE